MIAGDPQSIKHRHQKGPRYLGNRRELAITILLGRLSFASAAGHLRSRGV